MDKLSQALHALPEDLTYRYIDVWNGVKTANEEEEEEEENEEVGDATIQPLGSAPEGPLGFSLLYGSGLANEAFPGT